MAFEHELKGQRQQNKHTAAMHRHWKRTAAAATQPSTNTSSHKERATSTHKHEAQSKHAQTKAPHTTTKHTASKHKPTRASSSNKAPHRRAHTGNHHERNTSKQPRAKGSRHKQANTSQQTRKNNAEKETPTDSNGQASKRQRRNSSPGLVVKRRALGPHGPGFDSPSGPPLPRGSGAWFRSTDLWVMGPTR